MPKLHSVRIAEKDSPNALAANEDGTVSRVLKSTGFVAETEIFRGEIIYTKGAKPITGSLLLKGTYKGHDAVLKIQGLQLESSELDMIREFERQNKSRIIHAPRIYLSKAWNAADGYGFHVMEYVDAPHIYDLPFASPSQMREFARFYQEYKTKAVTRPWIRAKDATLYIGTSASDSILSSMIAAVERWRVNAEAHGRIRFDDYARYLVRFYAIAAQYAPKMKKEFMHRQLTQEHIFKLPDGTYRLSSNLLWGYRMQWADLSYNLWHNLLALAEARCTAKRAIDYSEQWISAYKRIPIVKKDRDFRWKINALMLERMVGIILGDMGSGPYWGTPAGKRNFRRMLGIYQKLFDHFAVQLAKQ